MSHTVHYNAVCILMRILEKNAELMLFILIASLYRLQVTMN